MKETLQDANLRYHKLYDTIWAGNGQCHCAQKCDPFHATTCKKKAKCACPYARMNTGKKRV